MHTDQGVGLKFSMFIENIIINEENLQNKRETRAPTTNN